MRRCAVLFALTLLCGPAHAFTLGGLWAGFDGADHALVAASHLQTLRFTQVELSAKWQNSKAGKAWDYGADQVTRLLFLRVEDEWRQHQDHYGYGAGVGVGFGALSATYGLRFEEPDIGGRQTFGRGRASFRFDLGLLAGTAVVERLDAPGEHRTDYRVKGQVGLPSRAFVGGFFEDVRGVPVRGIEVGIKF